jgi:cytochrome c oxidase subunit 3
MQGVWLFLTSLTIFFVSSILLYVVYVAMRVAPESGLKAQSFVLPKSFLPSTFLLVGISVSLEFALRAAKRDRNAEVKQATLAALVMGILFMAIQSEGMYRLIYAASIASITVDQQAEVDYLKELAHGLRLSPRVCNQIHQQYGIRPIF